ncbi:MAG: response regulator [Nitrospirota bacterium]|nr:MAG: response regulator [Nitrospirota bacterium]
MSEHDSSKEPEAEEKGKKDIPADRPIPTSRSANVFGASAPTLGTVLVVDDEPDVRKVVGLILKKAGYEVLEAADGEQAIETLKAGEDPLLLRVIVTDIRMPVRDGVSLVKYLLQEWPSKRIIVLTGFPDLNMALGFLKVGAIEYLVKPVEQDRLLAAVAKAFDLGSFS